MVSLYRKTVYNAWIMRSREENHNMSLSTWSLHAYTTLGELPGMKEESMDVCDDIWDITYITK